MALFSLLVAILVERLNVLPASLQFDHLLKGLQDLVFRDKPIYSAGKVTLAVLLPALCVLFLVWLVDDWFWGILSLNLWVMVAVLCFNHQQQRTAFKRFVQAARRGDEQACFHYAKELDPCEEVDALTSRELGAQVGQRVAWVNYRYYGAVALFFIVAGPVGAVLYCTVRYYVEQSAREQIKRPLVDKLLFLLDWLPARLFAFGYVFCGEFSRSIPVWRKLVLEPKTPARDIIVQTALAAEPEASIEHDNINLAPTFALLALSKRNFILLVAILCLLTIFGLVS